MNCDVKKKLNIMEKKDLIAKIEADLQDTVSKISASPAKYDTMLEAKYNNLVRTLYDVAHLEIEEKVEPTPESEN